MNYMDQYKFWLEDSYFDEGTKEELRKIADNQAEIEDRFYKDLAFGTGGLRGVIGAGTNRMNIYTVRKATQGLANYILKQGGAEKGVAIAYDSRYYSPEFADEAALCMAANGIKAYVFDELRPTPELSFALRTLGCISGIVVTASHNPPEYNGYKVYWEDGAQITPPHDKNILAEVAKVTSFDQVKTMKKEDAVAAGLYKVIGKEIDDRYMEELKKQSIHPEVIKEMAKDIRIVYTPLHGTGNLPVRRVLKELGFEQVYVVKEQELPDGNFPTCPYPNPEIRQAFELALKAANEIKPDILLATDPDCDRVGIAVPNKNGDYTLMSGNEVGAMLLNYLLSQRKANGTLPQNAVAVKSFVSTDLAEEIAKKYNCTFKNLLTGFKYIGELITKLEAEGRASDFIMGFEESYGYLAGTHARDKDAVVGSMLICEMAAYYKLQGKSLLDVMEDIYKEFGFYSNVVKSYEFDGEAGMKKMASIMDDLRQNPPAEFAGSPVVYIGDYKTSIAKNLENGTESKIDLPKSNVLAYKTAAGNGVIVRPSGTEPKIKAYITAIAGSEKAAKALADELIADADKFMA